MIGITLAGANRPVNSNSGRIWSLEEVSPGFWSRTLLIDTSINVVGFGEGEDAELYMCGLLQGTVYQIVDNAPPLLGVRDSEIFERVE